MTASTETRQRLCPSCGNWFTPRRDYHWQCYPCWRARQDDDDDQDDCAELLVENARLAARCVALEAELADLRQTAAIPSEQWRRLVQLAHPDRHNGSQAATEATCWLMRHRPED